MTFVFQLLKQKKKKNTYDLKVILKKIEVLYLIKKKVVNLFTTLVEKKKKVTIF